MLKCLFSLFVQIMPTEKVSEFLDSHMQPIIKKGWSYIKDSQDFINKSRKLGKIPDNAILVTADVVSLYPSIPHNVGLRALKEALDKREQKKIPTEDLLQMTEFVLKKFLSLIIKSNSKSLGQL